jgi:hypothetical protein
MGTGVLSILDIKFRPNSKKVVTFLEFGLNDGTAEGRANLFFTPLY